MSRLSRNSQTMRDAIVVALRTSDAPMTASDLQPFMPWRRKRDDTDCRRYPGLAHATNAGRRVIECHTAWHVCEVLPFPERVYQQLLALEQTGIVERIRAGQGRRVSWALTPAGAAKDEIGALRRIVDLDTLPTTPGPTVPPAVEACAATTDATALRESAGLAVRSGANGGTGDVGIDWECIIDDLGSVDGTQTDLGRSHVITAETYRYFVAAALDDIGVPPAQLELTGPAHSDYAAMTLYGRRRVAIAVADMRNETAGHAAAAAALMDVLHRTARLDGDERVLFIIAGPKTQWGIRVYLPAALHYWADPFTLFFQDAVHAGLEFDGFARQVPDLTLRRLHRRPAPAEHVILGLNVHSRETAGVEHFSSRQKES